MVDPHKLMSARATAVNITLFLQVRLPDFDIGTFRRSRHPNAHPSDRTPEQAYKGGKNTSVILITRHPRWLNVRLFLPLAHVAALRKDYSD
jgi:hypothetical protein